MPNDFREWIEREAEAQRDEWREQDRERFEPPVEEDELVELGGEG